jgi:FkbM family methyltransferase
MSLRSLFGRPKKHHTPEGKLALILEARGVDLYVDVGANIGQTGRGLRRWGYGGRILSFEPVADCHRRLCEAAARDHDWQVMNRCAIGDTDGEADILVSDALDLSSLAPPTSDLMAALPRARTTGRETVAVHRLDTLFRDGFPGFSRPFLKIDTQGHDFAVLRGASGILEHIFGVQIEMSLLQLYSGEPDYLDVLRFLHDAGFRPYLMTDRTFSRRLNRQLQIDGVFLRDS